MIVNDSPITNKSAAQLDSKYRTIVKAIFLAVICVLVYLPAMQGGFIWDDDTTLTENPVLKEYGLYRCWFTIEQPNYWPITWMTYRLEYELWGLNPTGYHITNILIHTACALLIWRILILLKISMAWLAALIFAVHPVNVESVAWIAQRKTLLAMLFFLITILLYLKFEGSNDFLFYWLSAATFALAMLSKGSVVGLPIVLLLLAWRQKGTITRNDLLRSLPFFTISAVMSGVELWFQVYRSIGPVAIRGDNFFARTAGAGMAVWFYIYKAILPINLVFIYPRWKIDPTNLIVYVPLIALIGAFLLFWRYRQSWGKQLLFALSYYVVMLLPILGFFNIFFMRYSLVADHYQYAAIISIIVLAVSGGRLITYQFGRAGKIAAVIIVAVFGVITWQQCYIYKDEEISWNSTLRKNPNCGLALNNLGFLLQRQGRLDEAIDRFEQLLRIEPNDIDAQTNLGNTLAQQGKFDEAIKHYQKVTELEPDNADIYYNLGNTFRAQGKTDMAIEAYNRAVMLDSDYLEAHYNAALILQSQGRFDEAIRHWREVLRIMPGNMGAHNNLRKIIDAQNEKFAPN